MRAQIRDILDDAGVKFTTLCPFHVELHPTGKDCSDVLVVTVVPGGLQDPALAEDVVRRIVLVMQRYVSPALLA